MTSITLLAFCLSVSSLSCFILDARRNHVNKPLIIDRPPEEQGGYFDGDIIIPPSESSASLLPRINRQTRRNDKLLWPNGIMVYTFDENWPNTTDSLRAKSNIAKAMKQWEDVTCLRFRERSWNTAKEVGHNSCVIFKFTDICKSYVGRSPNPQFLDIGGGCLYGSMAVAHELAHAAGFGHEHTRPDRDKFVDVFMNNVVAGAETYFEKRNEFVKQSTDLYDIESIMHYGPYFFSKHSQDLQQHTIQPKDSKLIYSMGQREYLSFIDIKTMNDVYKCNRHCQTRLVCQHGGYIGPNCTCVCPYGLGGKDCTELIKSSSGCGGLLGGSTGRFTSPNSPNKYPSNTTCIWLIQGPIGSSITLTFTEFDFEMASLCHNDYVEVKTYGPTIAGQRYCQNKTEIGTIHYDKNALFVKFHSDDNDETFNGFIATYTIT